MDIYLSTVFYWIAGIVAVIYVGSTVLSGFLNMILHAMSVVGGA